MAVTSEVIMPHWTDGRLRGYGMSPVNPMPPGYNDISSRTARLEVHIHHMTDNIHRVEIESLQRGRDLMGEVIAIRTEVASLRESLRPINDHIGTTKILASWLPPALKFLAAAILFGLVVSGRLSADLVKPFLGVLGLPTG